MDSILQKDKRCFICGSTRDLHRHHIYAGSRRSISESEGFWVWLCQDHHTGRHGVHSDVYADLWLKRTCQSAFEAKRGHGAFMALVGKDYKEVKIP